MVERHPQTEQTPEIPQLTANHWQYIKDVRWGDPKISQFAYAVVNKRLTGDNQNHQLFLGQRHWKEIEEAMLQRTSGRARTVGMILRPDNFKLASDIYAYSSV